MPGRKYFIPKTLEKTDPLKATEKLFAEQVLAKALPVSKAIFSSFTGISPVIAEEICYRASIESDVIANALSETEGLHLCHTFLRAMEDINNHSFLPAIYEKDHQPVEFASLELTQYGDFDKQTYESISSLLENYYRKKNTQTRIRQKSSNLRRIVATALDRSRKKFQLQEKQLKDTEKKDTYRIYGELINTYGYQVDEGAKEFSALNYYTNETITIPLDPTMTALENGKKYFEKYNKLKRTHEALSSLIKETKEEILHLESIQNALEIALAECDLSEIKEELTQYGYIRRKYTGKKEKSTSRPFHYVTKEGYDIYVGKNNFQNDQLTFKLASGSDWWFHAKGAPGSHVIVKSKGEEMPDSVFEDAASLAAYYSSKRDSKKVEIDYVERKHIKKPNGGKPGFVVYYTNYSLTISPDISHLTLVST